MSRPDEKRRQKEHERDERIAALYEAYPDLKAIDQAQRDQALQLMRMAATQASAEEVDAIRREAEALTQTRQAFLATIGLDDSVYEPAWDCPYCQDRGHIQGRTCSCQKAAQDQARRHASGLPKKLQAMTFANFDPSYYQKPEDMIQKIDRLQAFCQDLAAGKPMGNLILTGEVGRGKTHLAAAVANCLLRQGGQVRYHRVDDFLDLVRRVKFDESPQAIDAFFTKLRQVDLLILDDLGAESISEFSLNQLQRVIEDRNLANKSWIVCTNLPTNAIEESYDARLADRLFEKTTVFRMESARSMRGQNRPDDVRLI